MDNPNYGDDLSATCNSCGMPEHTFIHEAGEIVCECGEYINEE